MFTGVTLYRTSTKFIRIWTQLCLHLACNTKKHLKYIEEYNFFYVWKRFNTVNSLTQHRMLPRNEQSDLIHNYARSRFQSFLSHSTKPQQFKTNSINIQRKLSTSWHLSKSQPPNPPGARQSLPISLALRGRLCLPSPLRHFYPWFLHSP